MGRGTISQNGSLFLVTKLVSRKQLEEPKSTNPSKYTRMSREWRVAHNNLEPVKVVVPKCGIDSPASLNVMNHLGQAFVHQKSAAVIDG